MNLKIFGNLVQAVVVLALVVMVGWLIDLLAKHPDQLGRIAMALCGIIGLFVAGIISENVGRVAVAFGAAKAQLGCPPPDGDSNG